jgi:hypothetical protein
MIGLLIMAVTSAVIGLLIFFFYGPVWGIAIAILTFVGWFKLNQQQGTTGLYKSNLDSYFRFRRDGLSVDQALETMVLSRYPSEEQMQIQVGAVLSNLAPEMTEEEKVINAVFAVFCAEQGDPPVNLRLEYLDQIRAHYVRLAERYNART